MKLKSMTEFLFLTAQVTALIWVTISYIIAAYSTIVLQTPFPVETLSGDAIRTILGVTALKVVGNIFEHNDGVVFGNSRVKESICDVMTNESIIEKESINMDDTMG